ncbi:DUF397 domain-containing protein [Herbihabitans rhizosphaerae]
MMTLPEPDGLVWRKSSYSASNGDCVEVAWRKSSYSGTNGNCVEVAWVDGIALRDSKNDSGPTIVFSGPEWRAFLRLAR